MMSQHPKHNFRGPIKLKLKRKEIKRQEIKNSVMSSQKFSTIRLVCRSFILSSGVKFGRALISTNMPREEQPSSRNKANRSHVQGQGLCTNLVVFLTVFPNFLTSGDCMSSIRIYGLQSCKNIEISNIAENWKMIKYIYFTMCYFFQKKVNAENSSLKNKIKRLVRSSLIDTLTLDFVSLRAFDKIKLHVIYVLDGRHGF